MRAWILAAAVAFVGFGAEAEAQELTLERAAFRAIYEELVEIDTSPSTGSCTRAAES